MTMQSVLRRFLVAVCAVVLMTTLPACKRTHGAARVPDGSSSAYLEQARDAMRKGDYEQAILSLQTALAKSPYDPEVHLNLGWLYLYTNEPGKTRQELVRLEALSPDPYKLAHLRGALYATLDQHPDAIAWYKKALKGQGHNSKLYFDMATSLLALNRNQEALDMLDKGFEYIPQDDLQSHVNFALASCTANSRLKNFEAAITDCQHAAEFEQNPESRQRINEMIANMQLIQDIDEEKPSLTEAPSVENIQEAQTTQAQD